MNLKKMLFWKTPDLAAPMAPPNPAAPGDAGQEPRAVTSAQVIALPTSAGMAARAPEPGEAVDTPAMPGSGDTEPFAPAPTPARFKGVMNAPELEDFFAENYFGYGRYNGSRFRSQQALESGRQALMARFQRILAELVERRQGRLDKLMQARLQVDSLSADIGARLDLAAEQVQREMATLREQVALAGQHKGWLLDALNRYQLGFDRGVRESLDFELLNA